MDRATSLPCEIWAVSSDFGERLYVSDTRGQQLVDDDMVLASVFVKSLDYLIELLRDF